MLNKVNKLYIGIIFGLVAPIGIFFLLYLTKYSSFEFEFYLNSFKNKEVFQKMLPGLLFINLGTVFLIVKKDLFKTTKGIIISTIFYFIIYLINKFII